MFKVQMEFFEMKMNIFALALASLLISSHASGSTVPVTFDHPGNPPVDKFPHFESGHGPQSHSNRPADFDWHQRFEMVGERNFHAEGRGLQGLESSCTNLTITPPSAVPVPAAVWLFMSGLVGMIGVTRRKKPRKD